MDASQINKINTVITDYFRQNPFVEKILTKDLMPLFISKAIFSKDYKGGLPIRKILRELDMLDKLYLIPHAFADRKSVNTSWYFTRSKNSMTKIPPSKRSTKTVIKVIPQTTGSHNKNSFLPIISKDCVVLILGSLPGDESLRKGEYYANPRNGFWKIMGLLFQNIPEDYKERCDWLLKNKIALWDVLEKGRRKGSLDSNIRDSTPNNFDIFFKNYPSIKYIYFNGAKAQDDYVKYVGLNKSHSYILLPSSSSARTLSFEAKVDQWNAIKLF